MSGFGALWRIRTRKHIRTMRSVPASTGPGRAHWPRLQEAEQSAREAARLRARQRLHQQRVAR
ncbi:MAG: hypothetical protein M5U01_33010 [Ardenticatenaceae bacterium]|nr:hypothetical protein [Ardenticatenaceae bacterium]HBY99590.1 hypothetical protein [Chloroflexota bacterium]